MAVTQNPHIGRSKGAFATAIFSKWKDKNVMRGKPITVANPRTPAQILQRKKFAVTTAVALRPIGATKAGFNSRTQSQTYVNACVSENLKNAILVDNQNEPYIDWPNWTNSVGDLTNGITSVTSNGDKATVQWENTLNDLQGNQSADDQLYIVSFLVRDDVAIDSAQGLAVANRVQGSGSFDLSYSFQGESGDKIHVYAFFCNKSKSKSQPSVYGTFTIS